MALIEWQRIDLSEDIDEVRFAGNPADLIDVDDLLAELIRRPVWHARAACRGQAEVMFPRQGDDVRPAQQLCASCPVQAECLRAGMRELDGIWGGTSGRTRRQLRRTAA